MTIYHNDSSFNGLQRQELEALSDAAIAASFRDIARRNYNDASATLFRTHVIEKARKFNTDQVLVE